MIFDNEFNYDPNIHKIKANLCLEFFNERYIKPKFPFFL